MWRVEQPHEASAAEAGGAGDGAAAIGTDRLPVRKLYRRSEQDERVRIISITPQGSALKGKAGNVPRDLACSIGMSPAQGRDFKTMCNLLLDALGASEGGK